MHGGPLHYSKLNFTHYNLFDHYSGAYGLYLLMYLISGYMGLLLELDSEAIRRVGYSHFVKIDPECIYKI